MATDPPASNANAAAEPLSAAGAGTPAGPVVPATAISSYNTIFPTATLAIGKNVQYLPGDRQRPGYWFVAVDLTTQLNIVASAVSYDGHSVPADIQKLLGDPRYFLFVMGNNLRGDWAPQGALYTFLKAVGSGRMLESMEQIVGQLGTGMIPRFSYVLAATMNENDLPGFEAYSDAYHVTLTMQFLPIKLDDKIVYAPIQQTA